MKQPKKTAGPNEPPTTIKSDFNPPSQGQPSATAAAMSPMPDQDPVDQATVSHDDAMGLSLQTMARRDEAMVQSFQGLMPASIGEAILLANHLGRSEAVPKSARSPENALAIIMAGIELGLPPMRAMQNIINIKGNLAMKADLQLGLARRSGTLDYFDEGFEFKGKTDRTLAQRKNAAGDPFGADLILALVEDVPEGKPYGWCTVQRKGDRQAHTRVFTWLDAERFVYNGRDDEEDGGGQKGPRVEKKLSEKSNYKNSPQDMYPKRARVRVLQVTHSDVLAGLPAVEALDGVFIDAEVVTEQRPTSTEDQIAIELGVVRQTHSAEAETIQQGFRQLDMAIAKRLQLLKQFKGRPADLVEWLKTEYANRRGQGRKPANVLTGGGDPKPVETATAPVESKPPADETRPASEPATTLATTASTLATTTLADIATKFSGMKGQSF